MRKSLKELDVKVMSISGVVEETQLLIVDGVKGTRLRLSMDSVLRIWGRKGTQKDHGLVESCQSSRDTCCYIKEARSQDRGMVSRRRGIQELETRCRNFNLALWRW